MGLNTSQNSLPTPLLVYKCKPDNQRNHWKECKWNSVFMMSFSLRAYASHVKSIKELARRIIPLDHQRDIRIAFPYSAMVLLISPLYVT